MTYKKWFSENLEKYKGDPEVLNHMIKLLEGEFSAQEKRIKELESAMKKYCESHKIAGKSGFSYEYPNFYYDKFKQLLSEKK